MLCSSRNRLWLDIYMCTLVVCLSHDYSKPVQCSTQPVSVNFIEIAAVHCTQGHTCNKSPLMYTIQNIIEPVLQYIQSECVTQCSFLPAFYCCRAGGLHFETAKHFNPLGKTIKRETSLVLLHFSFAYVQGRVLCSSPIAQKYGLTLLKKLCLETPSPRQVYTRPDNRTHSPSFQSHLQEVQSTMKKSPKKCKDHLRT